MSSQELHSNISPSLFSSPSGFPLCYYQCC